ncbi:vacuolar H[+] ATPase AC45 accessory subunit [Glossina fuscipes fuscipes]
MLLKLCAVLFSILAQIEAGYAPVFLLGVKSTDKPSLIPVGQTEFIKDIIEPFVEKKAIVVFVEKYLNHKDFSCGCFDRLEAAPLKTYYAAVEDPVEGLKSLTINNTKLQIDNTIDDNGDLEKFLDLARENIIFINFDDREDFNKKREVVLREHDEAIAKVIGKFGDKAYYIYTASKSTKALNRQRREVIPTTDGYMYREGANLLLYFRSLAVNDGKDTSFLKVDQTTVKVENSNISVTMATNASKSLTFNIELSHGYFHMANVEYDGKKFRSSEVNAPTTFSYFCGDLTLYRIRAEHEPDADPYTLHWHSLQFQAPFNSKTKPDFIFGDAWHCVGFFSGGILMGLLIVVLLLTILFAGVCWMLDINTMDRFDDPKGKTITINTSE